VRERFSKRTVLRTGYGAVILVLVLSAIEAYRIQIGVSKQHLEIYRHFVEQDNALTTLRRNLWLAGNDVRDFFIQTTPEQAAMLRSQIEALKADDEQVLNFLARSRTGTDIVPKLRKSLGEFWAVVEPLPETMLLETNARQFEFLQREIAPRRGQLYNTLIDLSAADQQRLQEGEREFAEARTSAIERLLLMLALSVLLSFVVARQSIRYAENLEQQAERHYAEVEQAKGELQQLSARLLEIEEEGRRRLSRELHDEIGQTLALLQIEITHAQGAAGVQADVLRQRLQRARELAARTVQTVRNISLLLRPALLDDLGLVPALQFQLEDFMRRSGIAGEFAEENVADELPDTVKTCVYRIVQEALHNCEKHSGASRVRVSVCQLPGYLAAEVDDNGRGFELNEQGMPSKNTGLGLLGIRERTAIAGGTLVVDSAPRRGTRIAVRIPLPPVPATDRKAPHEVTA
jgi:signal transduction histidine kinase